ncbi:MAG: SUMF1/EgtB/PvdO family nonheme iron enzyme [Bradymonadales bacterium]|nr:SUMF1/EgtB/PvdO family nonheme iron enzyme [Bradymonadales bacterium]
MLSRRSFLQQAAVLLATGVVIASCVATETVPWDRSSDPVADGREDLPVDGEPADAPVDGDLLQDLDGDEGSGSPVDVQPSDLPDGTGDLPADQPVSDQAAADLPGDGGQIPNQGWIGGACTSEESCDYTSSICLTDGYPNGMCSLWCTQLCPDSTDPEDAVTFCIQDPDTSGQGICVSRCDWSLFPSGGCREGYRCVTRTRFNEPSVSTQVCLPDEDSPSECTAEQVPQPNLGIVTPAGLGGCPPGMAPVGEGTFCMDRWEAFLVEVLDGGTEAPWSPYFNPGERQVRAVSAPGAVPQGYINQLQAQAACERAGKRLCSLTEWSLACRGPENTIYPYGNTRQPGVCNDARAVHPVVEYFGTTDSWIWSELGHPCINQLEDSLDLTGANSGCLSHDGMCDMMGNLHEWVDDPQGTFKGGFYVDTSIKGEGCLYTTEAHNVYYWDYSTGFRCCAD